MRVWHLIAVSAIAGALITHVIENVARAEMDYTDINVSEYDYNPDYDYLDPDSIAAEEKQKLAEFWDHIVIEG